MSRLRRLITNLASRTDVRTGKSVRTSGALPLTKTGTFGRFPLSDYGIYGAVRTNGDTSPSLPVFPSFVGEARLAGNAPGLSLTVSSEGPTGDRTSYTVSFPGIEPLRSVSGVSDEIGFGAGKLIRRVGVCRDPVPVSGIPASYGKSFPAVTMLVGDGTTIPTYPHLASTHWKEGAANEIASGSCAGMAVIDGVLAVSLPRALYRRYVTGCVGSTYEEPTELVPLVEPGEYRCDFLDGTSRVFTLIDGMYGSSGCRDVLAVSRGSAILKKNTRRLVVTGSEDVTVLRNYRLTGESLFRLSKEGKGVKTDGVASKCSYFTYADMTPLEMIQTNDGSPAICEDGQYWYFFIPGKSLIAGFQSYMNERAQAGKPVTIVYPAATPEAITLTSYRANTKTVRNVSLLVGVTDKVAFESEADLTLIPAIREFLDAEREEGRPAEIYYVLPASDVTETTLTLPALPAGEGATTFSVASAHASGADPVNGWFTALCAESE